MKKVPFILITCIATYLMGCGLDCIDKKTGLAKTSNNIQESREKGVFQAEFIPLQKDFYLDHDAVFRIRNAWLENRWRYECVKGQAVFKKDTGYQFIVEADYFDTTIDIGFPYHWLGNVGMVGGIGGCFSFYDSLSRDSIILPLSNGTRPVENLTDSNVVPVVFVRKASAHY